MPGEIDRLIHSDAWVRSFIESLHDAIVSVDADGRIVFVNAQTVKLFGYAEEELLGEPVEVLLPAELQAAHRVHRQTFMGHPVRRPMGIGLELAGRRKDGTHFPVDISLTPLREGGTLIVTATIRDRTEQQRQRRILELVGRTAMAANVARTLEDALQVAVDAVCVATGWPVGHAYVADARGGRVEPKDIWHLSDPARFQRLREVTLSAPFERGQGLPGRVLEEGRPAWVVDIHDTPWFVRAGERDLQVASAFGVPVTAGDRVVAVLEFFSDRRQEPDERLLEVMAQVGAQLGRVAERQEAEGQRMYAAELERSNRELELFAYAASHDLQEPLRMVISQLQRLERRHGQALDERGHRYMSHAIEGAVRMRELIRSLLAYSRVGTHKGPHVAFDLSDPLDDVLADLEPAIAESGAVVGRGELPRVEGDRRQIAQLLQNLLTNALKFRREGVSPRVHVSARPAGDRWHIAVRDEGIGIDPQYTERVFEVFERLHPRESYPGTGIGLSVCRRIVEGHGGTIWIESTPGEGTTVHFTLPAG